MKIQLLLFMISVMVVKSQTGSSDGAADRPEIRKYAFVELPGLKPPDNDWIFTHAKVALMEDNDTLSPANLILKKSDDAEKEVFGLLFLRKKEERGLPADLQKREKLFDMLNSKMKSGGITHWYIFQMRATGNTLIGVYGPVLYHPESAR